MKISGQLYFGKLDFHLSLLVYYYFDLLFYFPWLFFYLVLLFEEIILIILNFSFKYFSLVVLFRDPEDPRQSNHDCRQTSFPLPNLYLWAHVSC